MMGQMKRPIAFTARTGTFAAAAVFFMTAFAWIASRQVMNQPGLRATCSDAPWRAYAPIPVLPTREEMLTAICDREIIRSFAEVGVKQGFYAEQILSRCEGITHYIGVDMWASQEFYDDGANVKDSEQERFYQETRTRLEPFSGRWRLMRDDSIHAASTIPDGSLDFVYLDARHDYRSV
jgi:hypothetical protein